MADIDLGELAEKEIAKRDRKIGNLETALRRARKERDEALEVLGKMKKAKDALLEAADWLDPYRYDDD